MSICSKKVKKIFFGFRLFDLESSKPTGPDPILNPVSVLNQFLDHNWDQKRKT
jgi:hypothetical protein